MSNKTILQGHNNRISDNNDTLNTISQMIDNLPEAGSGGGNPKATFLPFMPYTMEGLGFNAACMQYYPYNLDLTKSYKMVIVPGEETGDILISDSFNLVEGANSLSLGDYSFMLLCYPAGEAEIPEVGTIPLTLIQGYALILYGDEIIYLAEV